MVKFIKLIKIDNFIVIIALCVIASALHSSFFIRPQLDEIRRVANREETSELKEKVFREKIFELVLSNKPLYISRAIVDFALYITLLISFFTKNTFPKKWIAIVFCVLIPNLLAVFCLICFIYKQYIARKEYRENKLHVDT